MRMNSEPKVNKYNNNQILTPACRQAGSYFRREYKKHGFVMFACLAFIFIFTSESHSVTEAGQVLTVKKKVYMIRDEQRSNAEPQMPLLLKDAVETDRESRTKLFFNDDSILNLGELSRIEVEEYLYSPEKKRSKSIYRLIEGSLKVVVGRSDLEIHTPTAVAAARGTKFIIWAEERDGSARTCAMVSEGEVLMKSNRENIEETATVKKGDMSCVPEFRPPDPVIPAGAVEQKRFSENTMVIGNILEDKNSLPERMPMQTPEKFMENLKKMTDVKKLPPIVQEPASALTPVKINIVFP